MNFPLERESKDSANRIYNFHACMKSYVEVQPIFASYGKDKRIYL